MIKNEKGEIVPLNKKKRFIDGCIGMDIPTKKIQEFFNV
jgi:hypothetical protein